jgi:hypothetical protein
LITSLYREEAAKDYGIVTQGNKGSNHGRHVFDIVYSASGFLQRFKPPKNFSRAIDGTSRCAGVTCQP